MNKCEYVQGNGSKYYRCPIINDICPYQRWCTTDRIFKLTDSAEKCTQRKQLQNKTKKNG